MWFARGKPSLRSFRNIRMAQRRSERRRQARSIIPNLFTVMNLFSGFVAIERAMVENDFVGAAWFVVLGGVFDMLDGLMARLTRSASEFGVELDSLADVVTFGVAPSAILFKC